MTTANVVVSGGLQPFKFVNNPQQLDTCLVPASEANNLFKGDVVQIVAGAGAAQLTNGPFAQQVQKTANTGAIYGVIIDFLSWMTPGTGSITYNQVWRTASVATYCLVRRFQLGDQFIIMDDGAMASGANSANTAANASLNANLSIATAGSQTTGLSNMRLGGASAAATATLQLKIIGIAPFQGNDPTLINCRWIVTPNNIQNNSAGTGIIGY